MTQQPYGTNSDPTDALFGGGASLSFADAARHKNVWRGGTIIAPPTQSQQTDFQTKAPVFWPDGNPKMQVIVKLQTDERDPSNPADQGVRTLYIKGGVHKAVSEALAAAGAPGLRVGGTLHVQWTGEVPSKQGSPRKVYTAHYGAPTQAATDAALAAPAPQQPQAPAAPAQQGPAPVYGTQAPAQQAPWPPQVPAQAPAQYAPPAQPQAPAAPPQQAPQAWPPAPQQAPAQGNPFLPQQG